MDSHKETAKKREDLLNEKGLEGKGRKKRKEATLN